MAEEQIKQLGEDRKMPRGFTGFCGVDFEAVGPGYCRTGCTVTEHHLNPWGAAHGGLAFTVMDSAAGVAALTCCPEGKATVTQCADSHFLRPVPPGRITAEARVLKSGRNTALVSVDLTDSEGRLLNRGEFEIFFADRK